MDNFTYLLVTVSIDNFTCLLVTVLRIDRQCDIPIVRTIAYCADLSEPIGRRNRYRQPDSHTYLKNNTLLYRFLWTYWSKQQVSIDKFACLSKVSTGIDMQYPNILTYHQACSIAYCPGCAAIQINPWSSIPAGFSITVIRTVVFKKYILSSFFLIYVLCSTSTTALQCEYYYSQTKVASHHLIILSLKSISRCILAFGRVRSPPSIKYQVFGVDYCRALPCRTYAIRTHSLGFAWITPQPCIRHDYYTYSTLLLYRHRIRFVVNSDVPLNPACGRSSIGAERPILIPSTI